MIDQNAEPLSLMLQELIPPSIDGWWAEVKTIADPGDRLLMSEVEAQDMQNEGKAVGLIGDDHIRKDRMVAAAGTAANDRDPDDVVFDLPMMVIHKEPAVDLVKDAVAARTAAGADFQDWVKGGHGIIKRRF